MLLFTLIVRQRDALALAADTDTSSTELEQCKVAAKTLLRKLAAEYSNPSVHVPPLLTIVWKIYMFHVLSESGVSFLTMCDTAMPASVALAFLEDVAREFLQQYGSQVEMITRPYCFIKFDLYLQRTKKVFATAYSSRSMDMSRVGRTTPVRRTFDEVMTGIVSKPGSSALSGQGGRFVSDKTSWSVVVACVVVVTLLVFCGVFYYVVVV
ncbi:SEC22 vesicle trafficking protein A/C [Trypanosoma rangeli]|uniref:SEC22 vesicle trafficking protein A/C n=1 Tax=Trypanosoma rangeli TaxID=5698 RepID=A0A422NPT7_TRYRA|nr:SEC22 vesicle trafficking protein A/C [Trypanosoma rangeli]RNF07456.1 SEC22 vesicle trafficking protein A/C [Trypanosoma rangeli]|eukprot:RNF07456.1 SEC22 vesicle trafficking protein A/C [Trypanosoma rangeli]